MAKRQLRVDMVEVLAAMDTRDPMMMMTYFLDLESGEVQMLCSDLGDDEDSFAAELEDSPDRFAEVPTFESHEKYDLMCRFAESVDEEDIEEMLALALRGKGAFSRFRDVVFAYPDLADAWRAMERAAMVEAAEDWLDGLGIEPVYELPELRPSPALEVAPRRVKPARIDLLDTLLLGAPGNKTELVEGKVLRLVRAATESEARALFKSLARELCAYFGLAWRKRFIKGVNHFDVERAHLRVKGTTVELAVDVQPEIWSAFRAPA